MFINLRYRLAWLICPELKAEVLGLAAQISAATVVAESKLRGERQNAWRDGFVSGERSEHGGYQPSMNPNTSIVPPPKNL